MLSHSAFGAYVGAAHTVHTSVTVLAPDGQNQTQRNFWLCTAAAGLMLTSACRTRLGWGKLVTQRHPAPLLKVYLAKMKLCLFIYFPPDRRCCYTLHYQRKIPS